MSSRPWGWPAGAISPGVPLAGEITREWATAGATGRGIHVAIIDSGVDATHPGLSGGVQNYVTIDDGPDGVTVSQTPHVDLLGHGTACAGIIRSLAPECEISASACGQRLADVVKSHRRSALGNRTRRPSLNLSLGTTKRNTHPNLCLAERRTSAMWRSLRGENVPVASFPSLFSAAIRCRPRRWPPPLATTQPARRRIRSAGPGRACALGRRWHDDGHR